MTIACLPIRSTFAGLAAVSAVCIASAAFSAGPPPQIDVEPDPHGASGLIRAEIDINAPPEAVWKVLVDSTQVPHLMVGVKYCHVLQRDPAGHWDVREQVTNASLLPAVRAVIYSDYDEPRSVRFHRTDGDFKILEGEWRLDPLDAGLRTRVTYESRMSAPFFAPGPMVRAVLRSDMPRTLINLRAASEAPERVTVAQP